MYFDYIQLGRFEKRNRGGILTVIEHLLCTSLICSKEIFNDANFMGEELKSHEAHVTCPSLSNNQASIWVYITLIQSPSPFHSCSQVSNDSARLSNIVEIVSIPAHHLYLPLFLAVNWPYILQAPNTVENFEHSSTKDRALQHPDQKPWCSSINSDFQDITVDIILCELQSHRLLVHRTLYCLQDIRRVLFQSSLKYSNMYSHYIVFLCWYLLETVQVLFQTTTVKWISQ